MEVMFAVLALCGLLIIRLTESRQKALFLGLGFGGVVVELYIVKVLISNGFGLVEGVSIQRRARQLKCPRVER